MKAMKTKLTGGVCYTGHNYSKSELVDASQMKDIIQKEHIS